MVVATDHLDAAQQGPDGLGAAGHQARGMPSVGAGSAGRGLGTGPVHHSGQGSQPDLRRGVLGGALDRFQHPVPTMLVAVLLAVGEELGGGVDQATGLLGRQLGDAVGQRVQRLFVVRPELWPELWPVLEPPFCPVVAGSVFERRAAGGPSCAVHNASLTST